MVTDLAKKLNRKIYKSIFGEPAWINKTGDFRARERFGLIERPNYVYGMLRAADCAKYFGLSRVTAIEFGVASGAGLLNMTEAAQLIENETGIGFDIVGFDTGAGLPQIVGFKDHPEIWNPGDFAMEDRATLLRKLGGRARVIWGDIADTVGPFTESITSTAPIGFISVDVDIYSATKSALKCLLSTPGKYTPAVSMYFDDVSFFFANRWSGELAAIHEFNSENESRKIDHDRSLTPRRPVKLAEWYSSMYICHILDHPARQGTAQRQQLTIGEHTEFMKSRYLF
jgi:hypothetical protein